MSQQYREVACLDMSTLGCGVVQARLNDGKTVRLERTLSDKWRVIVRGIDVAPPQPTFDRAIVSLKSALVGEKIGLGRKG